MSWLRSIDSEDFRRRLGRFRRDASTPHTRLSTKILEEPIAPGGVRVYDHRVPRPSQEELIREGRGPTRNRTIQLRLGKRQWRETVKTCSNAVCRMEPRRPFDPLRPAPIEPTPAPFRPPGQYFQPRDDELMRLLKDILDRLAGIEGRLKVIEDTLKTRH